MHAWSLALVLAFAEPPVEGPMIAGDHELPSRDWEPPRPPPPPPVPREPFDGTVTLVIGSVLLGGGLGATVTGTVLLGVQNNCGNCKDPPTLGWVGLGVGSGMLLSGSIAMIVSHVIRTKHRRWTSRRAVGVRPSLSFGPTAMQIGLGGRF